MKVSNSTDQASQIQGGHVHSAKSGSKASKAEGSSSESASSSSASSGEATKSEISAKGRELAQAKEVANGAPDVREEKIAKLKEMISAGKYKVDSHAVADRMVDEHLASGIG
jgi:flagellar biosynthesis anti-sigma factor FlgM